MKVNIFISHKHEDKRTAFGIRDILKKYDHDDKVHFFLSEEIIQGENWYECIKDHLSQSNLLLLLFTDVTQNWNWCLYEAGLFDRLDENHHGRIICMHPTTVEPPEPLQNLQAVAAEPDKVEWFLKQLYTDTQLIDLPEPIAPWLAKLPDVMSRATQDIISLVARQPVKTRHYGEHIFLHVENPESIKPDQIPPKAKVTSHNPLSWEIFDLAQGEWAWEELEREAQKNKDSRWIRELATTLCRAKEKRPVDAIQATFRARRGKKTFRPILYRTDWQADGSIIFKVLFNEDVSWQFDAIPQTQGSLLTSLVMATRFKYELLEKFGGHLDELATEEEKEQACKDIRQVIWSIEEEAEFRGIFDRQLLCAAFHGEDQQTISQMYDDWYAIRDQLINDLEQKNCETVEQRLAKLKIMNKQYLSLATRRYVELMTE